jgi:apolipoprotein D and lipocalin family protein
MAKITMQEFDILRYLGSWKEAASIPQAYEKNCTNAYAIYGLNLDNSFSIDNYCEDKDGLLIDSVQGVGIKQPGQFSKSRFLVKFTHGEQGTYWVYDTNYTEYAIVSNQDQSVLWILSRDKSVTPEFKQTLLRKCQEFNLPADKLVWR